jgi:hypothetical protein
MNPLAIIKAVSDLVVSTSVGYVVGNAVKTVTPTTLTKIQKIQTVVGGAVLAGATGAVSAKFVRDEIDNMAATIAEAKALKQAVKS